MHIQAIHSGLLAVFLCACANNQPCEDFGVRDDGQSWRINEIHELTQSEITAICGDGPEGYLKAGCVKLAYDDINAMNLYWTKGDWCAEAHERSHARCGRYHTERYNQDIANGHPRPAC